ncbi:MAG: pilus assembly protein [Ruminococcaceae bacterium]|nr:pilus assembly protein [Oscillospiraceae bacterium]
MTGNIRDKIQNETGAVQIVEAAFVFPVMFIILLFLIYMGNAHYIKAQIESVVESYAIQGANYCADPILETIQQEDRVPAISELKTQPYRYLFGGMNEIERSIGEAVDKEISGTAKSAFANMNLKLKTPSSQIAKFHNYVVYSTFSVSVEYEIEFPIQFLGEDSPPLLKITSRAEMPVSDTAEFIRNTDMVIDLFEDTKIGKGISDAFGKINDFISTFASK